MTLLLVMLLIGMIVGFVLGIVGVYGWIEQTLPGTSKKLLDLDERAKKNAARRKQ